MPTKVEVSDSLKKPLSAYFQWLNANRDAVAKAAGSASGPSVGKKGGEMWNSLPDSEKKPWEDKYKQEKEKYDNYLKTPEGEAAMKALKDEKKTAKEEDQKIAAEKAEAKIAKLEKKTERDTKKAAKGVEKDDCLKKPLSAYFQWLNANRDAVAKAAGSASGPSVGKKGGEMWKSLPDSDKKPWEDKYKQEKEEYDNYLKTPEGEAAMKAFKEAQTVAKTEIQDAANAAKEKIAEVAKPSRKRKAEAAPAGA